MLSRHVVVGGGISGLAAAHRLQTRTGPGSVVLVEAAPLLGGKILSERHDGFVLEGGPDCFLASKPAGMAMCRELGLADRLVDTDARHRMSFVKRAGRLHPLPEGITGLVPSRLLPLLTTRILSVKGRLRAGLEPLVPRRKGGAEDESVGAFVRRRFGLEAWEWLVEPLLSGIYAGDGDRMSLEATFPQLRATEVARSSLLLPMLAARFRRRPASEPPPRGFVTLPGGLGELVEVLVGQLAGTELITGRTVVHLGRDDAGYRVRLNDGATIPARTIILATPSHVSAGLLRHLDPPLADQLERIPQVSSATVSIAFRRSAVPRAPRGYGYLIPRAEGGPLVACSCTSNKFPARAPGDAVLFRCFVGRAGAEDIVMAEDSVLESVVRAELRDVLGIEEAPLFTRVVRWPRGMPQYVLGHGERRRRIDDRLGAWPGLFLAGASYRGVGIPDCIASGWAAAEAAAQQVSAA